jgi:hypothetical protein
MRLIHTHLGNNCWQEPVAKESSENVDSCALKWQLYVWFTNWWMSGGGTSNPKTREQWQANHQQHQTGWNSGAIQYWRQLNIPILQLPLTQPFPIARVPGHSSIFLNSSISQGSSQEFRSQETLQFTRESWAGKLWSRRLKATLVQTHLLVERQDQPRTYPSKLICSLDLQFKLP